jgi:hypothetical protein
MNKIILISLVCFTSAPILKSQVTIGIPDEPVKGALLDLKAKAADSENVTAVDGKGGGLVLARVKLKDKNTLEPFIPLNSAEWSGGNLSATKKAHVGMMVYNLYTDSYFLPGIYVWDGNIWVPYQNADASVTASNGLTKTGDNIKLGGTLTDSTAIVQGEHALSFIGGNGDRDGKIYMPRVRNNVPDNTNNVATLGIDNISGELYTMKSKDANATTKALNYVTYELEGHGDWVQNFDTQIKANDYTVVIVGSMFKQKTASTTGNPAGVKSGTVTGTTYISSVYADRKFDTTPKDTWIIHADYADAAPADGLDGTWTINCLVISNSLVNVHAGNPMKYVGPGTGNSKKDITAGSAPTGLQ